jgi:predicted dehydrogenase
MKTIRWGILGCGVIARKFAADLRYLEGAELSAVGSRDKGTAVLFGQEFGLEPGCCHGNYEALAADPAVDVIYVATPHAMHCSHSLLCMEHGKAVLCEKPLAINCHQVLAMIGSARRNGVFLMEAMWSKFLPQLDLVREMIDRGELGKLRFVRADFGFAPGPGAPSRLIDPALGGGSLLDIGIYPVFLAVTLLGRPDEVEAWMTPLSTGVDEQCAMTFRYEDGAMAQLFSSFASTLSADAEIAGSTGRIRLGPKFYSPAMAQLEFYPGTVDNKQLIFIDKKAGFGFRYEAQHVAECLRDGLIESPVMSHADSLLLMETMDRVRVKAGIIYEVDKIGLINQQ